MEILSSQMYSLVFSELSFTKKDTLNECLLKKIAAIGLEPMT